MLDIKDTLELLNPWWKEGKISKNLALKYRRKYYKKISSLKNLRQVVILSGLRRVGKTTLLYQNIEDLLKKNNPKKIFYFNFDKEVEDLLELLNAYSELTGTDFKKEKIFVFFDEITKLKNWAEQLKIVYDSLPNIKFFVSSSSSVNLEQDAIKNLAGRYFLMNIYPLFFEEFLEIKNKQEFLKNKKLYAKELKKEFELYFSRSFPECVFWEDELLIKDYLKTTLIDKIVKIDLSSRFDNLNVDLLFNLLDMFYSEPGIYLEYDNLAKNLRVSKKTLFDHIFYLEFCYLIRIVRNFRPSTLSSKRKLQRVYPYWWNMAFSYCSNRDKLLESFVASIKNLKYYWREGDKEVDFLEVSNKEISAFEVKNKEKITRRDISNLLYFLKKYHPKGSFVISKTPFKIEKIKSSSFVDFALDVEI
ncbi:MAG: ATP-binding protein [Candidatus Nanoarchaeia archaeon]